MKFPVFDLHCDTAMKLVGEQYDRINNLRENTYHIDLERAKAFPGYAQCFACYTSDLMKLPADITVIGAFERMLASILTEVERNSDVIRLAYSAQDVRDYYAQGVMSAVLTIEGTAGIDFNPELLEDLYNIGFRITTLGWNENNPLTGSCVTGGGLTELGREYVREAQRLGMVVDVSHISDEAFWDIMEISQKPIIASHSNSRSLCDVPRNLTDDMYKAICKSEGTVGINLYPNFLGEEANVDTICNHIFHFLSLAGDDRHISLGSDFDGIASMPAGFDGVQDYPKIACRLLERGLSEQTVENIYWNNALGVIDRCSM